MESNDIEEEDIFFTINSKKRKSGVSEERLTNDNKKIKLTGNKVSYVFGHNKMFTFGIYDI